MAGHDGEFIEPGACSLQNNCYWRTNGDLNMAGCAGLADWQKKSGQEMLNGAAVGFQVDPRLLAPGSGGDLGDAARWKTLDAYNLLPSSPLIGKGLDLRDLFKISPGLCDFHGIPFRPIVRLDLGAVQSQ